MNIGEFLSLRDTALSSVVANVKAMIGLDAGDVLLAVGSIAEGLGNSKSDMDLLLITPRGQTSFRSPGNVTLLAGRCVVDVRVLQVREIEELLARFKSWSQLKWDVTHAAKFTLDERTLLHRLRHGLVLHKGKRQKVMKKLPSLLDIARLKLHVARQMSRTIQVDMAGYREVGDFSSLVFHAQELLGHTVDGLLAGYKLTNPLSKWRSRLAESVPADWERSLGVRPTGLTVSEKLWRLHRAPELPEEELSLEHAFRISAFARAVFIWAERKLVKRSVLKQSGAWPSIKRTARDSPLPYLDFDVDFVLADGCVSLARLNEFDEALRMKPGEFALTLLFDGVTTMREAEIIANGNLRGGSRSSAIKRLVAQMAGAGLTVLPASVKSVRD